jgi:hypothetical protein
MISMSNRTAWIIIAISFAIIVGGFIYSFFVSLQQIRTTQSPTTGRIEVTLRCDECAEAGMEINLWQSPDNRRTVGSVPNRTRVTVLDQDFDSGGTLHYKVSGGGVTGWVSELMVER